MRRLPQVEVLPGGVVCWVPMRVEMGWGFVVVWLWLYVTFWRSRG